MSGAGLRGRVRAGAVVGVLVVALTGCGGGAPLPVETVTPPSTAVATSVVAPGVGDPSRLVIGSAGVDAPVVTVGATGGAMDVPDDIGTVGYYSGSVPLGSPVGVTVLAGHVNDAAVGPGALARLSEVRVGDVVSVAGAAGGRVSRWVVDGVTVSGKDELPAFPVVGPRRLVVVTCGGELVRVDGGGSYADNVVVWASPA